MKLVVRDQEGSSSPTCTSSKWTFTVIARPLVPDSSGDPPSDEFAVLIGPLDLVVRVEHQAEAPLTLVEVLQPVAVADHVTGAHGNAIGVALAAVDAGQTHAVARRGGGLRAHAVHRPGEGVEVERRDDPAPAGGLGVFLIPVDLRRRLVPVGGDRPLADVGERDRRRMPGLAPLAPGLFHGRADQGVHAGRHPRRLLSVLLLPANVAAWSDVFDSFP